MSPETLPGEDLLRPTDLEHARCLLRLSEFSMQCASVSTFWIASTGRFLNVNHAACELTGYSREELLGMGVPDIDTKFPPEKWAAHWDVVGRKGRHVMQSALRRKDGSIVPVEIEINRFRFEGGEYDCTFVRDSTDRKSARDLIQLQAAALKACANGIVITDHEGNIEWVNQAFIHMTGYSAAEALSQNPRLLKSDSQDPSFYRQMWNTISSGRVWRGELINRRRDGSHYHEDMTITPVCDETGRIAHYIAIKQDVTDRKSAEKQLVRRQRLESLGTVTGGIAHDLNNCLAPILMSLELLKLEYPDANRIVEIIGASARRGSDMVKHLVTFAKGAEGERLPVQPRHLLKEMAKVIQATSPKNISVKCEYPADLPTVLGDATQLHQVLLNLCVNARDAMPDGGALSLTAATLEFDDAYASAVPEAKPGKYVLISVKDTGIGMPPSVLERLFEPFFTTKSPDKGTGLGLSTAMGIVKGHGGFIRVYSTPKEGSTFNVYLPAITSSASNTEVISKTQSLFRGNGETILVVDDEEAIRVVVRSVLERHNFRVITANDGAEGIVKAAEHRGDIRAVITDFLMPHLDGLSLARVLTRMIPGVGIIIATGQVDSSPIQDLTADGRRLLRKPFTEKKLLEELRATLAP